MNLDEIVKWDNQKWQSEVVHCEPSDGGAVGIVFVWTKGASLRNSSSNALLGFKKSQASFVIKPIAGSAAPTKFAEEMLGTIANTESPNSRPIPRRSISGTGLMDRLRYFRGSQIDQAIKARWNEVFSKYDQADSFLIQDVKNFKEFGDEYRKEGGLEKLLKDKILMTNLGKLFAADALIGNGDRLGNANMSNVAFTPEGKIVAIDSTTILTSFEEILKDSTKKTWESSFTKPTAEAWARKDIIKRGGIQVPSPQQQQRFDEDKIATHPVLAPSFALEHLVSITAWWGGFQQHLEQGLGGNVSPSAEVWNQAKQWFEVGMQEGIRQVDKELSGFNWTRVKSKFKKYTSTYGGDANLDWKNFKIRRRYIKLLNAGKSGEEIMADIKEYVRRKMPGL